MAYRYPRRVKDLDLDSDDELNVPRETKILINNKTNNLIDERNSKDNKENEESSNNNSNNYSFNYLLHRRMFPKRSSELPTLESDSEEEFGDKKDNLNCAILNESFILSPSKSDLNDTAGLKANTDANVSDNLSFVLRFDKMALSNNQAKAVVDNTPASKTTNVPANEVVSTQKQAPTVNITANTSTLANDTQFAPPQVRTFSVHRRQGRLYLSRGNRRIKKH